MSQGAVGNDVVDLDDVSPASERTRQRFIERVCAPSERELLAQSDDPRTLLWVLFAAKEAAFKLASKLGPVPVFAHRNFIVDRAPLAGAPFSVTLPSAVRARGTVDVHGRAIHAVAWVGEGEPHREVIVGPDARAALLVHLGLEAARVVRAPRADAYDGLGPPRVEVRAQPHPVDVSLSQDGRFAAFALVPVRA